MQSFQEAYLTDRGSVSPHYQLLQLILKLLDTIEDLLKLKSEHFSNGIAAVKVLLEDLKISFHTFGGKGYSAIKPQPLLASQHVLKILSR